MKRLNLETNPFALWIIQRIKRNKNVILIINGPTGSGKTYAGLRLACDIAERLGTNFSVKENVAFNFSKLLRKTMLPINEKPGACFLFEEIGVMGGGASSREWQSKANRFFNSFMQTTRYRNQVLILTCPQFSYLEKGTRQLVHAQLEMIAINPQNKISITKPYLLQVNSTTGKVYFKFLRFRYHGLRHKLKRLEFKLPPDDIIKEYELLKRQFTTQLNQEILQADNPRPKRVAPIDYYIMDLLIKKRLSNQSIADKCNCSKSAVEKRAKVIGKSIKSRKK